MSRTSTTICILLLLVGAAAMAALNLGTAPAIGSRNLLTIPNVSAPTVVPHKLPTPPNTTTMKLSMM